MGILILSYVCIWLLKIEFVSNLYKSPIVRKLVSSKFEINICRCLLKIIMWALSGLGFGSYVVVEAKRVYGAERCTRLGGKCNIKGRSLVRLQTMRSYKNLVYRFMTSWKCSFKPHQTCNPKWKLIYNSTLKQICDTLLLLNLPKLLSHTVNCQHTNYYINKMANLAGVECRLKVRNSSAVQLGKVVKWINGLSVCHFISKINTVEPV